jgi:hypothetical protein
VRSSTVSALRPAAENGNPRAIQALAEVAADENARSLWWLTAGGLEKAAISGNITAIDAMALLARSENSSVRKMALMTLEHAALQQHSRAHDALRSLGYQ